MDFLPDNADIGRESGDQITKRTLRNHTPAFKAKVALAAIKGEKTLSELAQQLDIHPNQSRNGRVSFLKAQPVFSGTAGSKPGRQVDLKALHAKIGEQALENDS